MRQAVLILLLCSALAAAKSAGAAAAPKGEDTKQSGFQFTKSDPIYITADWMEVDRTKNTLTYKGRVVTVQADMTMRSDFLRAYYDPEMKQLKQIVAEGNVNAVQGNRVATGQRAVFDEKTKTVTLTGNPIMRQGNSQVSGIRVIYFMDEDRAVAEGDANVRVRATIFPEDFKKQDSGEAAR
jgi:lipopolysaccharide export system protein LptA